MIDQRTFSLRFAFVLLLNLLAAQSLFAQGLGREYFYDPDVRPERYVVNLEVDGVAADFPFESGDLAGTNLVLPTTLDWGPDNRLYVAQKNGLIVAYTIEKTGPGDYQVTNTESINVVKLNTPNHDDDGTFNNGLYDDGEGHIINMATVRQITGILVVGTPSNPVIYTTSSDPREGAGVNPNFDSGLDTNSGVVHRLTKEGANWVKVDLVRGLPRSEENHSINGLQYDAAENILYVAVGGLTNAGSPSNNFARITEYALSAAILSIDLDVIDTMELKTDPNNANAKYLYDIPTLDDPTRDNVNGADVGDPFGGNNGLNQSKIVEGGPVQLHATGFRNPYDVLITSNDRMYTIDNGANAGWGGFPEGEDEYPDGTNPGECTNNYVVGEPGASGPVGNDNQVNNLNGLHYVREVDPGFRYYGGHPAPVRGNPEGAGLYTKFGPDEVFRTSTDGPNPLPADWPPIPPSVAYAAECDFRNSGEHDGSLADYEPSTNGLDEYTATIFEGALQGSILSVGMNGDMYIAMLNEAGDQVTNGDPAHNVEILFQNVGGKDATPLDIATMGDDGPFPGTIWTANFLGQTITVFEPSDLECDGGPSEEDEDGDGYSNNDEIDNGTGECNPGDKPRDNDADFISDLNDPDDDNDGVNDVDDSFAIDAENGLATSLPVLYDFFNGNPPFGFFSIGFTGLMNNGATDYIDQFDRATLITGGTAGQFTVPDVDAGDALNAANNQKNAFQFGIDVDTNTGPFTASARIRAPFFNSNPQGNQNFGMYIGTGDQDNYLKVAVHANGGSGGVAVVHEIDGSATQTMYAPNQAGEQQIADDVLEVSDFMDVYVRVDPVAGTAQPGYSIDGGEQVDIGSPIPLQGSLLAAAQGSEQAMAVGMISTNGGSSAYIATWDRMNVVGAGPTFTTQYRVNAGGPQVVTGGATWEADATYATGGGLNTNATLEIAGTTDDVLYQSERWDQGTGGFSYSFPVPAGSGYSVVLHFAEIFFGAPGGGAGGAGKRVFSVDIEGGQASLTDLDIFAEAGAANALVKIFDGITVSDGALDISFSSSVREGKVSAIEIRSVGDITGLSANPAGLGFQFQSVGETSSPKTLTVSNSTDTQVTVNSATVTGTDAGQFSTSFTSPIAIEPGGEGTLSVTFTPASVGPKSAMLELAHTGPSSPLVVNLSGQGVSVGASDVLYRINVGGPSINDPDGKGIWSEDQSANVANTQGQAKAGTPSIFVNAADIGDKTFGTAKAITLDGSVSPAVPVDLFKTERWDPPLDPDMTWSFPVETGQPVMVNVFLAENFLTAEDNATAGPRVFDIQIEGTVPSNMDNVDVFAAVGSLTGMKLSHPVTSDGAIDIVFIQDGGNQNPSVKAIELIEVVTPGTDDEDALPASFVLHGNYPNPFNPSTTVVFDLPRSGEVSIQVYDMLGRRVLGTEPEMLPAGTQHQIVVDGSSLASGIYLYRVVAHMADDTVIRSGRMSLVK